jgi:hypothetical protein
MPQVFPRRRVKTLSILITALALAASAMTLSCTPWVQAQTEPTVLVTGYTGTSINYTLTQLKALPSIAMYGGFYQQNQQIVNNGLWTGIDLLTLCDQVGGITSTCTVTVKGQGTNSFTYEMVQNGLGINQAYKTYNNLTGAAQNQTQRMYIILAYAVNGTDLSPSEQPAPRLVAVGAEGLLMVGSGGRGVTQVTIVNSEPNPTPSPSPTASPSPSSTATTEPTATLTATPQSTATSPTPTTSPTANPTSTPSNAPTVSLTSSSTELNVTISVSASSSPKPEANQIDTYIIVAVAAIAVVVVVIGVAVILRRR